MQRATSIAFALLASLSAAQAQEGPRDEARARDVLLSINGKRVASRVELVRETRRGLESGIGLALLILRGERLIVVPLPFWG